MPKPATQKEPVKKEDSVKRQRFAVIRIRGMANIDIGVINALENLRLVRPHVCVIVENTPSITGMIRKAKDYVTWGEIDDMTLKLLEEKRGEKDPYDPKKLKQFFRLSPPRKGFERKGVKVPFGKGGALGYRGAKINDLIKRMM